MFVSVYDGVNASVSGKVMMNLFLYYVRKLISISCAGQVDFPRIRGNTSDWTVFGLPNL